ncbi:hypothetical protein [Brachyspira sp.]|uniref:hypothetical protein n=1 Tax=Brachyspira sp. TaxID=1977261 RepID=UPI00261D3CBF|nr:hypothetical protein [Brachyspira sp.]
MKNFTKDDLETGMIIETRNCEKYLVLKEYETKLLGPGMFADIESEGFLSFSDYSQSMYTDMRMYDIMRVWDKQSDSKFLNFNTDKRTLLFNRYEDIYDKIEIDKNAYQFLSSLKDDFKYIQIHDDMFYVSSDKEILKGIFIRNIGAFVNSNFEWLSKDTPLEIKKLIEAWDHRDSINTD